MSVPGEGAQRLAEIFREIFALSETSTSSQSKSENVDESMIAFDGQAEIRAKNKQRRNKPAQADNHETLH